MKYFHILIAVFLLSLLAGQFGSLELGKGIYIYLHDIFLAILLIFFLVKNFKNLQFAKAKLAPSILLFIFSGALSLVVNSGRFSVSEIISSSLYLIRWIFYAGLYGVVLRFTLPSNTWISGTYAVGVGFAFLGFLQLLFLPYLRDLRYLGWDEHYYRLFSTLLDPNFVGILLILAFFLGMHLWGEYKDKRIGLGFSQILLLIGIYYTFSRSAYISLLFSLIVYVFISKQWKILLAVFFCFAIFSLVAPKASLDVNRIDRLVTAGARVHNWQISIERFLASPVFGHGFNTLRVIVEKEKGSNSDIIVSRDASGVDSSLLLVLVTTGVVGGVAYIYLLKNAFLIFWNSKVRIAGTCSLIAVLIHSFFNNSLFYAWVMIWLWILFGVSEKSITSFNKKK